MPLQKAHVTIPLGGGIATAMDDKLLPLGKVVELENARQGRLGEIVPRAGTQALGLGILGNASTIPAPWEQAQYKGALVSLSQIGDYPLAVWNPSLSQWSTGGQSTTTSLAGQTGIRTARRGPIFARGDRLTGEGTAPDIAYASGLYFDIYQYLQPGATVPSVYQRITGATTGKTVAEKIVTPGAVGYLTGVRTTASGYAVFCYSDAATSGFIFDVWQISNLDAGPTTYTAAGLGTGIAIRTAFDMITSGFNLVQLAYYHVGTNAILGGLDFTASTGFVTTWILNDATAATVPLGSWNWVKDLGGAGTLSLATYSAGQGVRLQRNIPAAGATRQAAATVVLDAAPGVVSNIVAATVNATDTIVLYDNISIVTPTSIVWAAYANGGVGIGPLAPHRLLTLRSKIWKEGSDFYVVMEMPSSLQNTRFITRIDTAQSLAGGWPYVYPVAKAQLNNGVLLSTADGSVSDVVSPSSGTWVSSNTVATRISGQPSAYGATYSGIDHLSVSYKSLPDTTTGAPREALDSLFVPGGMLGVFDGVTYCSSDFAAYPERLALTDGGAGGTLSAGTYFYKATYARTDATGRTWRSAPSVIQSVGPLAANHKVTAVVPTLRVVDTSFARTVNLDGYFIELWRGDHDDNNTYKLAAVLPNVVAADSVTFTDNLSDALLDSNEFLYTNGGGILPNDAHPGFTSICIAGNRVWGAYKNEVWMSNTFVAGRGLMWSEQNKIILNDQHGDVTGLSAQPNGVVCAFKGDAVYAIAGDGPDQAGRGGFQVQFASIGTGTINPRSIVETSVGTEFLSTGTRHGWWRIGLGLTPEYIGGAVERYIGATIVGAIMLPSSTETRYYMATGGCLVHDYLTDLWGIDTGSPNVIAAAAWGGLGVYATSTPAVISDSAAITGFDPAGNMQMKVTTPWISLADLRGYERMYRMQGIGELGDDTKDGLLTVTMQKNFDTTVNVLSETKSPGHLWDWEVRYSAKFDTVRFIITSLIGNEDHPAAVKWSAIVLEYGIKQGMGRRTSGST